MLRKTILAFLVISAICSACNTSPVQSPVIPTRSFTSTPRVIQTDAFDSTTAHRIPLPSVTPGQFTPSAADIRPFLPGGKALDAWKDIPVMPNAFSGEEAPDGLSYRFAVKGRVASVNAFYSSRLPELGWTYHSVGESDNGSIALIYARGNEVLSIAIMQVDEAERILMVILVLS